MILKSLGKILLFILLGISLFANDVSISVSNLAIYKGDTVSFTITANSADVEFPNITHIESFTILGTSNSSSTSIINGKISRTISKTYTFRPTKDITIPSFEIKIDGHISKTKPQKISILKPTQNKDGDEFIAELKIDKQNLKVGESAKLTIVFKQRVDAKADKINLNRLNIQDFWIKKIDKIKKYSKGDYLIQEISYLIFAQKSGNFTINPIKIDIGKFERATYGDGFFNDPFFNATNINVKWSKIYSNSLKLKVEDLPNNIELYGDFHIKMSVDKTVANPNQPVNIDIQVDGIGNIDDVKKFDLYLDNAVVYANKPQIKSHLTNDNYGGTFRQKIVVIANNNFTIPPFKLVYFDKITNKLKTIETKSVDIKIKGNPKNTKQQTPILQKSTHTSQPSKQPSKVVKQQDDSLNYLYFMIGLLIGGMVSYLILKRPLFRDKEDENDMIKLIKNTKEDKELFRILLPYANKHKDINSILRQLEENIYKKSNHKIDKQKLYDIFLD